MKSIELPNSAGGHITLNYTGSLIKAIESANEAIENMAMKGEIYISEITMGKRKPVTTTKIDIKTKIGGRIIAKFIDFDFDKDKDRIEGIKSEFSNLSIKGIMKLEIRRNNL